MTIAGGFGTSALVSAGTVVSRSVTHYDAAGRVDWTERHAGTDVRLKAWSEFDSQGRVIRSVTYRYDPATQAYSEYSSTKTEYDKAGRVSKIYDAFGVWTVPTYDADGRVTRTALQDGTWAETAYDDHGRKERETVVADWAGEGASKVAVTRTTNYGYDASGRLATVTQPAVPHPVTGELVRPVTTYGYDPNGQRVSITDANGQVTAFGFDKYGQQTSRTLPDDGDPLTKETETTTYTRFGEVDYAVDFNGTKVDYVYDYEQAGGTKFGRVTAVTWTRAGQSVPEEAVTYVYGARGRPDTAPRRRGGRWSG